MVSSAHLLGVGLVLHKVSALRIKYTMTVEKWYDKIPSTIKLRLPAVKTNGSIRIGVDYDRGGAPM